jgi:hypothetical protein
VHRPPVRSFVTYGTVLAESTLGQQNMPNGQPALNAALERFVNEQLAAIVPGGHSVVQEWDGRIDLCVKLDDGRIIGEMVDLTELNSQAVRASAERLLRRKADPTSPLVHELFPPFRILPSGG